MTDCPHAYANANFTAALAHLLSGEPGQHDTLITRTEVILAGCAPDAVQLMRFAPLLRQTGRPVLWIHPLRDAPHTPQIGLVAMAGEQLMAIEYCFPWMSANGKRVYLIPDGLDMGAFRFDADLRLHYEPTAPMRSFARAKPGIVRAFRRLYDLQVEQFERGDTFTLPVLFKAA